jgi:von Willebrand factor type A C-terminal domain/von Willebrand factor type A domain
MTSFELRVFQNEYLPRGGTDVHAIVSVTASGFGAVTTEAVQVIMVDCSGSMTGGKIAAARTATCKAVDKLRDGTWFAVVSGREAAAVVYPTAPRASPTLACASPPTRAAAQHAVRRLYAEGGTAISTWLAQARRLFATAPEAIHHALLLTDGKNESESADLLHAELERCRGAFQCDCRGVGTDWDERELRGISDRLLGTTDIIPDPGEMDAEFAAIVERTMGRRVDAVVLHVWTPAGAAVRFVKQVGPEVLDLGPEVVLRQPDDETDDWGQVDVADPARPLLSVYPTGAWGGDEVREYHLCVVVPAQDVDVQMRAAGVALVAGEERLAEADPPIRAIWTDDMELSTQINRHVAHYTGQTRLAEAIDEGIAAIRAGDLEGATLKLGRAVKLARESGHEEAMRRLDKVVDVVDAEEGTVRLRTDASRIDEMTLDTRSRKTIRLKRT